MLNYNTELNKLVNKIYEKKICEILLKIDLDTLNNLSIDDALRIITSTEVYLGNDLENYLNDIMPKGADEYFLRVAISKINNLTYPILFNENREKVKSYSYNNFAKILWEEHTTNLLINDIYNLFNQENFIKYVSDNLKNIYVNLLKDIKQLKQDNMIVIKTSDDKNLVNTVKEMLINGELNFSIALTLIDMDKLREDMMNSTIQMDCYDEFDKLEDDLEGCLNKFFKYNDEELLNVLIEKENFKLIPNLGLVNS